MANMGDRNNGRKVISHSRNQITDGLGVSEGQAITLRGNEILVRLAEKMGLSSTPADTDFNERFWRTLQANVLPL
jgi:hypothetical protein